MPLSTHHLTEEETGQLGTTGPRPVREAVRAARCGALAEELVDVAKVQSEQSAVLLVPFEEGPLNALYVMYKLRTESPRRVDKLLPVYINRPDDYSLSRQLASSEPTLVKLLQSSLPLGVCYEGGNGETLLNTSRLIRETCEHKGRPEERQLSLSVRVQAGRLPALQFELADFGPQVDFGWADDSSIKSERDALRRFPATLSRAEIAEIPKFTGAMLRQFLNNSSGAFTSPLWAVEKIRGEVLRMISERSAKETVEAQKISRLDVWKHVDGAYIRIEGYRSLPFRADPGYPSKERNLFVNSLIHTLEAAQLVEVERRQRFRDTGDDGIRLGPRWTEFRPLIDCYLTYSG